MKKFRLFAPAVILGLILTFAAGKVWAASYQALSPINNVVISGNVPTFTWNADTTGLTYNSICLWNTSNCPGSATYGCPWNPSLSDRSYTPSTSPVPLNWASSYSWVLYGCNSGCGVSAGTGCQNFRTPAAPTPPTVTSTTINAGSTSCSFPSSGLNTSLVSYWNLNDSGSTIADAYDSHPGTAVGTTVVSGVNSSTGNARSFTGNGNDYIATAASTNFAGTAVSFSVWFKPSGTGSNSNNGMLFSNYVGGGYADGQFYLRYDLTGPYANHLVGQVATGTGVGAQIQSASTIPIGSWTHAVLVWDNSQAAGNKFKLFVNGYENWTMLQNNNPQGTALNTPTALFFGSDAARDPNTFFAGTLDEIGVWTKALSSGEIASLYSNGNAQVCGTTGAMADGSTIYNITTTASDNQGGTDIIQQFAMVNYGGAARGLLGWDSRGGATIWGANSSTVLGNCALYTNGGTGYGYGNEYMTLMGCNSSPSGNNRTTTFSVKFNTNFIAPVTNTLYGSATDTTNPQVPWVAGDSFNLTATTCNLAMPALSPPSSLGLKSWWRMDETAGIQVADSIGGNDGYAKNTLYNNLVSYWKMDDLLGLDSRGTNNGSLSGQGCNFAVNSNYNNTLPGNLVSYWKLDENSGPNYADQMGANPGSTPDTCNFNNSLDTNLVSYWPMNEASGNIVSDKRSTNDGAAFGCTIGTNTNLSSSLVGYWNLNETSGVTAADSTGNGNHGTISNATSVFPAKVAGGWSFVQSDTSEISAPIPSGLSNTNVTVATWVYLDSTSKEGSFVKVGGPRDGFAIGVGCTDFNDTASGSCYGNNLIVLFEYVRWINTGRAIGTGWHHVAFTLDGAGIPTIYLDGVSIGSFGGTAAFVPGSRDAGRTWIGGYDYSTFATFHRHPVATLDEVGVWNRALSPTEMSQLVSNGNSGNTCSPSPQATAGKISNARSFNGSGDRVQMNSGYAASSTFTISAWLYRTKSSVLADDNNWITSNNSPNYSWYSSFDTNNNLQVWFYNSGWITIGAVPLNQWHQVAFVINGASGAANNFQGYIDGTLVKQTTITYTLSATTSKIWLGDRSDGYGGKYGGLIDEVGIWNRALSATEISTLHGGGTNPAKCKSLLGPTPGKINNAQTFDGAYDYMTTNLNGLPATASDITISFWANPSTNTSNTSILTANPDDPSNRLNIHLPWSDGTIYWDFGNTTNGRLSTPFQASWLNNWALWTFTAGGGGGMKIYRNGTLIASKTTSISFVKGTKNLIIGSFSPGYAQWKGSLDELGIWSRALSASEIANLYDKSGAQPPSVANPPACMPGPVSVAGKVNNSLSFGSNDQILIPDSSSFSFTNALTISAWVYPRDCSHSNSSHNTVVVQENGLLLAYNNSCQVANWVNVGGVWKGPDGNAATLPLNQWSHVAMTWDGSTIRSYLNGSLIGTGTTATGGNYTNPPNNLYIGSRPDYSSSSNIALGKTTFVSGTYGGLGGANAVDGNTGSYWNSGNFPNQWITVDLGAASYINRVRLLPGGSPTGAVTYDIQASNDNVNFDTVVSSAIANSTGPTWGDITFAPITTRYVRILATNWAGSWVAINEIEIYTVNSAHQTLDGYVDEVGIWNRVLSGPEINIVYTNGNSGVSYDPATGGGPSIATGAQNSFQDTNNYPLLSGTTLVPGKSRNFNGVNDYVTVSNPVGLPTGNVMTVTAWVKPTGVYADGSYNGLVSFGPRSCNSSFLLALQSSGKPSFAAFCNDFVPTQGYIPAVVANDWNHVAAVLNGTSITLYVNYNGNSSQKVSGTLGSLPNIQSGVLNIGSTDNPGRFFNGAIDEVRIYNKALTDADIQEEFFRKNVYPTGACGGTCDSGYFQPGYDRYCSPVSETCTPPNEQTHIVGAVAGVPLNASGSQPIDVKVDITNNPSQSQVTIPGATSPKTYDFTVGKRSSYTLNIDASTIPSGYTVNPQNYQMDIACASSYTGPTFWYNSDAGSAIQSTFGQLLPLPYYGSGKVSQSGANLGYRLESYANNGSTLKTSYGELYDAVARNSLLLDQNPCPAGGFKQVGNYNFYCYDDAASGSTSFETVLRNAINNGPTNPGVIVVLGDPGVTSWSSRLKTTTLPLTVPANKTVVAFVKGSLNSLQNVTVNSSSGFVVALDNANPTGQADYKLAGNLYVDPAVTELSGFYVFPGLFNDVYTSNLNANTGLQLVGYGSLISTSTQPLGFGRNYDKALGPAEKWFYQPKYLVMYKNILATPRYTWKEIAPQ